MINSIHQWLKFVVAATIVAILISCTTLTIYKAPIPGKAVIFLNFKGYSAQPVFNRTTWAPSILPADSQLLTMQEVGILFAPWQIAITTDPTTFYSYPQDHRMQIIISPDTLVISNPFGNSYPSGRSFINALYFEDSTPAVVVDRHFETTKNLARGIAHEIGHLLGLAHQSTFIGYTIDEDYNPGDSLNAPIMGFPYQSTNAIWFKGLNNFRLWQDDAEIISKTILLRPVDKKH